MKQKTKLCLILILLVAALWILAGDYAARAFVDETTAVHVDPASVEDATLAVGTHLIHLSAVTDEIYRAAVESAEQSGQDRRYYKSELGDGAWYDITEAAGIQSITEQGQPVEDRVIQDLFFRYHTRPDGITYDLLKKIPVNIFDEQNPYELWELPELEPLRQQSTMLHERNGGNKSDLSVFYEKIVTKFFDTKVHNDVTNTCDEELSALQQYYEALAANQETAERKNMVMDVMGAVDAARRAEVFRILQEDALPVLMDWNSGIGWTESELPEDFVINAELSQAAGVSLDNVGQSLIEEQADILDAGTTVLERSRFYYTGRLIQEARKQYYAGCNLEVDHLLYLSNIENSLIVEAEEELALLEELLESADIAYLGALASGESGEYRAGVANRSSKALLKQLLQTQKSDTNVSRIELQFLIQAKTQRMAPEEAKEFITQRIEQLGMFREVILQDAFADYAQETVEEYLSWLTEQLGKLSNAAGESELEGLMKEKTDLQDQRKSCLDENNLAGAKKLEAQIAAKDEEIAQEERRLQAILNAAETTQAQKALAKNALGNATVNSALNTLADNTIADIRDGDLSGMEDSLETLEQMYDLNASAAENKLKNIYQELAALQMREEAGTAGKIEQGAEGTGEPDDADKTGAAGNTDGTGGTDGAGGAGGTDGAGGAGSTDGTGGAGSTDGAGETGGADGTGGTGSADGTGETEGADGTGGAGSTDGMADNAEEGEGGEDTLESQETAKWMERIAEIMAEHITADTGSLTENEIHRLLRELLGSDYTSLGNKDKASALIAVNLYGEYTGSNAVILLAGSMADEAYRDKIPYVYQKPDQQRPEYAPADALAKCIGYRYIFDDTGKEATLRRGARFYRFRAADKTVLREEGITESMAYGAQFQRLLYLEEGYLYDTFQCQVEYIRQSDYGVIATQDMMAKAQELFEAMLGKGEN